MQLTLGGQFAPKRGGHVGRNFQFTNKCKFLEQYPINGTLFNFSVGQVDETCPTCLCACPYTGPHHPLIEYTNSMGVLFRNCTIESYYTMKWIFLSNGSPPMPSYNWNVIQQCDFINHGINMCDCDYYLGFFRQTNFKAPASTPWGVGWLNNQPGCGGWFYNLFDNASCLNIINFNSGSPSIFPLTTLYQACNAQPTIGQKYVDPPISGQIIHDNLSSCSMSLCSYSQPRGCGGSPRLGKPYASVFQEPISLKINPNPTSDFITVENNDKSQMARIINLMGKIEIEMQLLGGDQLIDIKKLSPGVYILQTEESHSYKFIKQ